MISSYQKSLWSRNLMLALVVVAIIGVALKIGWSLQKIKLYDQALAYYEAKDLVKAEETFAKANEHAGIEYGDEAWTTQMSGLTDIREELESSPGRLSLLSRTTGKKRFSKPIAAINPSSER